MDASARARRRCGTSPAVRRNRSLQPAAVRAISGDGDANAWGPWLGLAALAAVLYYDPKSTHNVRRDPMPPRTEGNSANA